MRKWLGMLVLTFAVFMNMVISAEGSSRVSQDELGKYFEGYQGTFILFDEQNDEYTVYNEEQSKKRIPPCSSFKIYNSLIGLETGVLKDENSVFKWDGTIYPLASWDKDNTLASAISNSVIWYYKEMAARVGKDKMQRYVNKIPYGNCDISGGATFWQVSSLKISAQEQIELLKRLYHGQLPFSQRNMSIVRKIITLSANDEVVLSGKTGSGFYDGKDVIGWFVGCVEKDGKRYMFVTNVEGDDKANGMKAKAITLAILKEKGLL